jgi:hypothetical protein
MSTFEIRIDRKEGDGWPVVVERTSSGEAYRLRSEGALRLDDGARSALQNADPSAYGTVLGQALFRDQILVSFTEARTKATPDDRLHVLLTVEAEDLRNLRWERLCAPFGERWDLLALNQEIPFSLYLPSIRDRRFGTIGKQDLRALIVAADPSNLSRFNLAPFDVAAAVASVQAALGEIPSDVLVTGATASAVTGAVGPATVDAIAERITGGAYTLLHIVAHGWVGRLKEEPDETELFLANADGTADPVKGTQFLERLDRLTPAQGYPRLAFLAACETASATAEAAGGLGGLAQRLVRDLGMPVVVAMTDKVSVSTASALAAKFYERLCDHGQPDLALVESTAGLAARGDILVPALFSRLAGVSLFSGGERQLLQLTPAEITSGLDLMDPLLEKRAPTLREDVEEGEDQRRGFNSLARQLRDLGTTAVNHLPADLLAQRETALKEIDAIATEALDLPFAALATGTEPKSYDDRPPFRGLNPFRAEHRQFFFGREALVEELRQRLADHPFLPVLGPSGSGKSSLVLAGLVPTLFEASAQVDPASAVEQMLKRDMRPGDDPLARLDELLSQLAGSPGVVVIDQFEEVFTTCRDESKRIEFFDRILALTEERPVVLTMRADFWGECAPYAKLRKEMEQHQRLIAPLDALELRRAIERQAGEVGLQFEADLAATILDQVRGEPGAMPLLQHALLELWNRRHGRWLLTKEYRAIGGVQKAIATTAERVYDSLSETERERMRDIFVRLTRLDEETAASGERRDTRRRVALEELVPAGGDLEATKVLVHRLADAGLVVTSRSTAVAAPAAAATPTPPTGATATAEAAPATVATSAPAPSRLPLSEHPAPPPLTVPAATAAPALPAAPGPSPR